MDDHQITIDKQTARRFLLESQLLWNEPDVEENSVLSIIKKLECLQLDPVSVIERNQYLVLHARCKSFENSLLDSLLEEKYLFEYIANAACIIPIEDYAIFEPIRGFYKHKIHNSIQHLIPLIDQIIKRLEIEGPLPSRAFKSSTRVHGYWDNNVPRTKETTLALNILFDVGRITVGKREKNEKYYTLTESHTPLKYMNEAKGIKNDEAKQSLIHKYMKAYRVFDFDDPRFGWLKTSAKDRTDIREELIRKKEIIPLDIEEVKNQYYILSQDRENIDRLSTLPYTIKPYIKFLPPLDNLLWRRSRIDDLFDFSYKWEIYFPKNKRKYGYYAMPILYGDSLIG